MSRRLLQFLLALMLCATTVKAQQSKIVVQSVKGMVQVRQAAGQAWQRAKVGLELAIGADIRTGLRSAIMIKIGDKQTMLLDRMSTVKLLDAIQADGKIKTDLGMKYGRLKYDVKAAGEAVESTVRAPSATLAVRGSSVEIQDDALTSYARGSGKLAYLPLDRRAEIVFGGDGEAEVNDREPSAGRVAQNAAVIDSIGYFSALTVEEFENQLAMSGISDSDQRDVLEFQRLLDDLGESSVGVPEVNGPLLINAFWITNDPFFADAPNINLSVVDPLGNTLSAANPVVGTPPAEGFHFGDNAGAFAQEDAQWPGFFTLGTHNIILDHAAGAESVNITLTAFQGGGVPVSGLDGTQPPIVLNPGQQVIIQATPVP